jgi:ribonuclease H / adenosylcobalamin/alpha-ribazole phosphatase
LVSAYPFPERWIEFGACKAGVWYNLATMEETLTLEFDGGSRGNPGLAGIGVVVRAADGTPLVTLGRFIGRATNNVAEYRALITALEQAKKLGARRIVIRGDSELIIKQMRGEYRVKHPDMKLLYDEAQHLFHQFDEAKILHNLRHKNELADKLANLAMDRKADVTEVNEPAAPVVIDAPAPISTKAGDRFACPRCGCAIQVSKPSSIRPHQLKPFVCQCGNKMSAMG